MANPINAGALLAIPFPSSSISCNNGGSIFGHAFKIVSVILVNAGSNLAAAFSPRSSIFAFTPLIPLA